MNNSVQVGLERNKSEIRSIIIIGFLFFIFGFVTWLNGTLIQFLKISCELDDLQALFVAFAFYIAYFIMAPPSSFVLQKVGYKNGMSLGLFVMSLGSLIFIPAALYRTYPLFLIGLFVQGTGLALLQTASNPYVIIIGPRESAAKRIAIMGICNKIAGVLSPLILSSVVLAGSNQIITSLNSISGPDRILLLNNLASRVIFPYILLAIILGSLSLIIWYIHLPEIDPEQEVVSNFKNEKKGWWQFRHLLLGFVAIFLYVGIEVIAGDTIGLYGQSIHMPLDQTRFFTSLTLGTMVLGYILGIITIPKIINQSKALAISAVLGILFTSLALITNGIMSIGFVALLGLANAMMWPSIFPLSIDGLGKFTKAGSALLVMGIAGGAVIPLFFGWLSKVFSYHVAYQILIPMYAFILFFALIGSKQKN